jgi:hypothetical protein
MHFSACGHQLREGVCSVHNRRRALAARWFAFSIVPFVNYATRAFPLLIDLSVVWYILPPLPLIVAATCDLTSLPGLKLAFTSFQVCVSFLPF